MAQLLGVNDRVVIDRWSHMESLTPIDDIGVRLTLRLSTGVRACSKFEGNVKKKKKLILNN